MNNVSENATEPKPADDTAFLENFEEQEKQKDLESNYDKCFDKNGDVIYENVTKDDILYNHFLYEHILQLVDEIEIQNYIFDLRQIAKDHGLAGDFDRKVKPYRSKALKVLKAVEQEQRIEVFNKRAESFPKWWDGQTIDEDKFCEEFLKGRDLRCINKIIYDINGMYDESSLENEIYNKIKRFCKKGVASRTKNIVEALKIYCYSQPLPVDIEHIHLQNGTLSTNGSFEKKKYFCTSRLNVTMQEEYNEPKNWIQFINNLLTPEDILTLQEYMGYCLIPCTKAQKMLMIIGNGGEGKSRIGVVMAAIFGQSGLVSGEVKDFDNGSKARFAREKLISRLVFLDDDLDLSALERTSFLKQLITAEIPLEIEKKGLPSYQEMLYSRVIAFGNGAITSLYDKSDGFYRRQIILTAKPKPKNRKDDRFLSDKLLAEKDDIFMWCFQGLKRLIANDFEFSISQQAKENLEQSRRGSCNIIDFMESNYDFCFDSDGQIHTRELRWAYENWCSTNDLTPLSPKTFCRYIKDHEKEYNIQYTNNAVNQHGTRARGFKGIKYLRAYKSLSDIS